MSAAPGGEARGAVDGIFADLPLNQREGGDEEQALKSPEAQALMKTTKAIQRIGMLLLLIVVLLMAFWIALLVIMSDTASSIKSSLNSIADSVGPDAVSNAVQSVKSSLNNVELSTENALSMSEQATDITGVVLSAVNESAAILRSTNLLMANMAAHPTLTMQLGEGGGR